MSGLTGSTVVFRVDASIRIGTGHVMRCLTLAAALRERGARCRFVSRGHAGHLSDAVRAQGFDATLLPGTAGAAAAPAVTAHDEWLGVAWAQDAEQTIAVLHGEAADWLVVDHYAIERGWESALRSHARRLLVIDDLADRAHECDLLLDQNLGRTPADYASRLPARCGVMTGPRFALLRPQFARSRERSLQRRARPALRRLLVALGGVDADNATSTVLDALQSCDLPADLRIDVVMGAHAPALAAVRERASRMPRPTEVRLMVGDMAELMIESDLAIGAAGGTAWERCCLGLPTLLIVLAANQDRAARALHAQGAAWLLGEPSSLARTLAEALRRCADVEVLRAMGAAAAGVADGGGLDRVANRMADCDA